MTGFDTQESIEAKLQAFLQDIKSPNAHSSTKNDGPLLVLHGGPNFEINHAKIKEIEAIRGKIAEFEECQILLRGELHHRILFQVTIHNSTLDNCTLIECNIYQSKIKHSQLKDCRIQKEQLGEDHTSLAPYITSCRIEKGTISNAYIYNSTFNRLSLIQSCYIESSLVVNSQAVDTTITYCGVHECELRNCEVVNPGVFLTESVIQVKDAMTFRGFPVEIRKIIYSGAIANEGLTTNLIAALRPDSLLYSEVLETLFQEHVFVISENNQQAVAHLPEKTRKRIVKVHLNMEGKGFPTKDVSVYFPADTKILYISIKFEGRRVDIDHFYNVTKLWFKHLRTVTKFKVVWTNTGSLSSYANPVMLNPPAALLGCIKVANKWLKTESVLIKEKMQVKKSEQRTASGVGVFAVPACEQIVVELLDVETSTWTWSAGKGSVLIWNS